MERKLEQGGVEISRETTKRVRIFRDGLVTLKDSWTGTGVTATPIFKLLVIGLLAFDFIMTTQRILYMPRIATDYEQVCSPKVLNPSRIEYHSNHNFYSALRAADLHPPPTFHGEHAKLCDEQVGMRDQYSYCLPISGRKDTPFCTNADRINLLNIHSSKPICYASVLHMLLVDVYDELQATGNIPFLTFGSLLGAVRNQSMIPFTEDADIGYVGELITLDRLKLSLRRKGYHMFFMDIWRVCVAPTHPLVSSLRLKLANYQEFFGAVRGFVRDEASRLRRLGSTRAERKLR